MVGTKVEGKAIGAVSLELGSSRVGTQSSRRNPRPTRLARSWGFCGVSTANGAPKKGQKDRSLRFYVFFANVFSFLETVLKHLTFFWSAVLHFCYKGPPKKNRGLPWWVGGSQTQKGTRARCTFLYTSVVFELPSPPPIFFFYFCKDRDGKKCGDANCATRAWAWW
jgi:hypothetical protein